MTEMGRRMTEMRLIDADALKEFIDECRICNICPDRKTIITGKNCAYFCDMPDFLTKKWEVLIDAQPTTKTKSVKYFDEDEKVWKIGEVIVDEQNR